MLTHSSSPLGAGNTGQPAVAVQVFDIGGTWFRSARFAPPRPLGEVQQRPAISFRSERNTPAADLKAGLIDYLVDTATAQQAELCGISLGAAMDARSGLVYGSGPLWGSDLTTLDLPAELARRAPGIGWHVLNDVTSALMHYASHAANTYPALRKIMLVTVSTGIACRTVDLRTGCVPVDAFGLQGEIGHLPVAPARLDGRRVIDLPCDCGGQNHLAAFSSGRGLRNVHQAVCRYAPERWARSAMARLLACGIEHEQALTLALDEHDPHAQHVLCMGTRPLADALRCALALDPEIDQIVLTGGVSTHLGQHYLDALGLHFQEAGLYLTSRLAPDYIMSRLSIAPPGSADGLQGAGLYALARHRGVGLD